MIFGTRRLIALSLASRVLVSAIVAMTPIAHAEPAPRLFAEARQWSLPEVMSALARRRSGTARFREERYFRHLTAPIILTGTLSYTATGRLVKSVETPRKERLVVDGDTLIIHGPGNEPPRTALLSDMPALAGTIIAMRAILSGDVATLRRHFTVSMTGVVHDWRVTLVPKPGPIRQRIARITVNGTAGSPSRFEVRQPDGDRIVTYITEK